MTEVILCKNAGFCFGVDRAVRLAKEGAKPLYCIGQLVHNRFVMAELAKAGVIQVETVSEIPEHSRVLIRSHGGSKQLIDALSGFQIIDATCPSVKRIHHLVRERGEQGTVVLMLGNPVHPEVQATVSWWPETRVFSDLEQLSALLVSHPEWESERISVVSQTTAIREVWENCVEHLKKRYTNLEFLDTICNATDLRQREAKALSLNVDRMLIIGDPQSSNTRNLACVCQNAVQIQSASELTTDLLRGIGKIGITAGASTPGVIIEEVLNKMSEEILKAEEAHEVSPPEEETISQTIAVPADVPEPIDEEVASATESEDESFESMLEASLKTLTTGDKVTGLITGITPTELQVDLGTKHAGYIPVDELSDDPSENFLATLKVGDEIEVFVVRVNDVEGTAMLSRKRLETVKSWEAVEAAKDTHAILEGVVTEENKGGIVVSIKGVRVFVPASQSGLPKGAELSSMLKEKVKLRIIEFNRARRRILGSIRDVQRELKSASSTEIWDTIEVGNEYHGIVKSLTTYGAFVDIGGVDGMVHVSELSWKRVHQPSDVLKIGDPIDVHVLSFDKEKKKISLGHRKESDNPWAQFIEKYHVGDIFPVKVVKLMTFGAFCEVIPGVDGLVHISQLADHRVVKPSDVVSEGDTVNVSLLDIDNEHKKLSLSIRAANAPAAPSEDTPDLVVVSVSEGEPEATALDEAALDVLTEVVAAAVVKVDLQDEKESGESTESAPVE